MSFTVEKLPNDPVIVQTFNEDYDLANEIKLSNAKMFETLDAVTEEKVYLVDVFKFDISFEDIIKGANIVARGERPLWHHPKLKQIILVTEDSALRLAAEGMESSVFGGLKIPVFSTVEEALVYTRANP
ncbi:MAG: hypothetical protein MUF38_03160 [Anaerolineae bacterium]|jgi:hypothetical protein|nr:hypothetical protein [Anaerolineae bacterium]